MISRRPPGNIVKAWTVGMLRKFLKQLQFFSTLKFNMICTEYLTHTYMYLTASFREYIILLVLVLIDN